MADPDELYSGSELAEAMAWDATEPGLLARLERRRAQLAALADLGAPGIILEHQLRLVTDTEEKLGYRRPVRGPHVPGEG